MIPKLQTYMMLYLRSLKYIWKASKKNMLCMLFIIPIQSLLPSVTISIANALINNIHNLSESSLITLLIVWGIFFLLNIISTPLNTLIQGKLTDYLTYQLNYDIMKKSEQLQTIDYFEDSKFYNDVKLLSSESSWRPVNLLVFGTSLISNSILFLSMLFIFSTFHPLIAIAMLFALIPQAIVSYKIQQQAFEILVSNSEESRKLEYYSQVLLSADAIKDVRLYHLYPIFLNKYTQTFQQIKNGIQKTRSNKFKSALYALIFTAVLSVGSFIYIILAIRNGILELGAIMLFATSIVYAINSMARLIEDSSLLYDTLLYMEILFKFINLSTDEVYKTKDVPENIETIQFQNISFTYPNSNTKVLNNIHFDVKKGEKIAIVGENGAGKTTLIKLLCQFYKIDDGDILINQHSFSSFDPNQYRKKIEAIFQDFSKFDLTLRENVALSNYKDTINDSEIIQALHKSGFENITDMNITLGKKFENSRDLSGGQWQKVALARAFFSNAPILILDEPTAALDARTEYELFEKFLELTKGKTVFYITHRLSSVRQADKILVLKNGGMVGFDSHENLMKDNDYYKELYTMQSSLYFKEL